MEKKKEELKQKTQYLSKLNTPFNHSFKSSDKDIKLIEDKLSKIEKDIKGAETNM